MKKKALVLLSILMLITFTFSPSVKGAAIPTTPSGLNIGDDLKVTEFYPFDFEYSEDTKFYLNNGTYLGKMIHLGEPGTNNNGRTFAHKSTYYQWAEAMGGNPNFAVANVRETALVRKNDNKTFIRAHSRALAEISGAGIEPITDTVDGGLSHVVITPTSFPQGSFSNPSVVNVNENFDITLNAEEFNIYDEYIRWELVIDNWYEIDQGVVAKNNIKDLKIPVSLSSSGNRGIKFRLYDKVERKTEIYGSIFVNEYPNADFTINPNPTNRLTDTLFKSTSTDPEGGKLSYMYEYRKKGTTTWTPIISLPRFSDVSQKFNSVGIYEMRLEVTDPHGAKDSIIKEFTVENLSPNADFTISPNPTDPSTNTTFSSTSTDPEGDSLTYKYEYRKKGTQSWTQFSTAKNASRIFGSSGTYEIRLTVTDSYSATSSKIKDVVVNNSKPNANFTVNPNPTDRLTTTQFNSSSTDPDGDSLSHQYEFRKKGMTNWTSLSSSVNPSYKFNSVGTYEVKLTVTDPHGEKDSLVKEVIVNNLGPVADFSMNPNPTNRLSTTKFTNLSTDPEGDPLTYKYEYRLKGTTAWISFSTSSAPSYKFNQVGTMEVRLTVEDTYGATDSKTKEIIVNNIKPNADFSINPNPTDRLTTTSFTSNSTDPEGDSLLYKYEFRKKGTSSWTQFSTSANPSYTFKDVSTYEVRLTVTDSHGAIDTLIKEVIVENLNPSAGYNTDKNSYFVGDKVVVTNTASDPENDSLTYNYLITHPDGTTTTRTTEDFMYTLSQVGNYTIKQTVTDTYNGSDSITMVIPVNQLSVTGHVLHTSKWDKIHKQKGNKPNQFYTGEVFELEADVTNLPVNKVEVKFTGLQVNGTTYTKTVTLTKVSGVLYDGQLHDAAFTKSGTSLQNGMHSFTFTAYYSNGTVRTDDVPIEIIGSIYDAFKFHRKR